MGTTFWPSLITFACSSLWISVLISISDICISQEQKLFMSTFKKMLALAQPRSPSQPVFMLWSSAWNTAVYCRLPVWLLCLLSPGACSRQTCLLFADVYQWLNWFLHACFLAESLSVTSVCWWTSRGEKYTLLATSLSRGRSSSGAPKCSSTLPIRSIAVRY